MSIKGLISRLRRGQRGESPIMLVLLVPVLFVVVGLVVDGGGKVRADEQATLIAQSAARAGSNAGSAPGTGSTVKLNRAQAALAAKRYLAQSGAQGSVQVSGTEIRVTASVRYEPKLLRLGIPMDGEGSGSAEARSNEAPPP